MEELLLSSIAKSLLGDKYSPNKVYFLDSGGQGLRVRAYDPATGQSEMIEMCRVEEEEMPITEEDEGFEVSHYRFTWYSAVFFAVILLSILCVIGVLVWRSNMSSTALHWLPGVMARISV